MVPHRTYKTAKKYWNWRKNRKPTDPCPLCRAKAKKNFKYWRVIGNDFPFDKIAKRHDMLVPVRHITETELTKTEIAELNKIKKSFVNGRYCWIIEPMPKRRSIPGHFHLHLINGDF